MHTKGMQLHEVAIEQTILHTYHHGLSLAKCFPAITCFSSLTAHMASYHLKNGY